MLLSETSSKVHKEKVGKVDELGGRKCTLLEELW